MAIGQAKSATFILQQIREKRIDPKELTPHHRKICLRYFMDENPELTERQIAQILGTSHSSIARYKNQIIEQDRWIVDKMDARWYATHLRQATRARIKKLEQVGKWEAAHRLEMDLADRLMDLGVIERAPAKMRLEGQITLLEILKHANNGVRHDAYPCDLPGHRNGGPRMEPIQN